jgi:hypothetical protein
VYQEPIRTPAHPDARGLLAFAPTVGASCFVSVTCMAHVRLALAFGIGDAHLFGMGSPSFGGGGVGLALGSPFLQLGPKTSPLVVAVRAGFDLIAGHMHTSTTYIVNGPVTNVYDYTALGGRLMPLELSASLAVSHEVSIEVRGALGLAVLAQQITAVNGITLMPNEGPPCAVGMPGAFCTPDGHFHHFLYASVDAAAGIRF